MSGILTFLVLNKTSSNESDSRAKYLLDPASVILIALDHCSLPNNGNGSPVTNACGGLSDSVTVFASDTYSGFLSEWTERKTTRPNAWTLNCALLNAPPHEIGIHELSLSQWSRPDHILLRQLITRHEYLPVFRKNVFAESVKEQTIFTHLWSTPRKAVRFLRFRICETCGPTIAHKEDCNYQAPLKIEVHKPSENARSLSSNKVATDTFSGLYN
jgi:hypothetical protein